jgi:hypothetical protein
MVICSLSFSQQRKLEKNYKYLKREKFAKVYKNLNAIKSKNSNAPVWHYLMSLYFIDKNNGDRNIDSSYLYLNTSINLSYKYLSEKELDEYCTKNNYCIHNLTTQLESIARIAFDTCMAKNDIASLKIFVDLYRGSSVEKDAIKRLDQLLYYEAKESNSISTLKNFIANNPNSDYIVSATKNIENLFYAEAIKKDELDIYNSFLNQYPNSIFSAQIELKRDKKAFDIAVSSNTETGYNYFIAMYPKSTFVKEATTKRDRIAFDNALSTNTETGYNSFIAQYPQSTFVKEATTKRDKIAFDNALSTNTETGYNSFIAQYPQSTFVKEAILKRDKIVYDEAKVKNDITTYKIVLEKYPDIVYVKEINEDILQLEKIQMPIAVVESDIHEPAEVENENEEQAAAVEEDEEEEEEEDEEDEEDEEVVEEVAKEYFTYIKDKEVQRAQGGTGVGSSTGFQTFGDGGRYNFPELTATTKIKGQKIENLKLRQTQKLKGTPLYKPIVSADGKKQVTGSIYSAKGFRIVIYNGSDKNAALAAKNKFSRTFPGTRSYLSYNVPSYKIKIGDFENKNEATKFLRRLIAIFPSSFIAPDLVTVKKITIIR